MANERESVAQPGDRLIRNSYFRGR